MSDEATLPFDAAAVTYSLQRQSQLAQRAGIATLLQQRQAQLHGLAEHGDRSTAGLGTSEHVDDGSDRARDADALHLDERRKGLGVRKELHAIALDRALDGEELEYLGHECVAKLGSMGLRQPAPARRSGRCQRVPRERERAAAVRTAEATTGTAARA